MPHLWLEDTNKERAINPLGSRRRSSKHGQKRNPVRSGLEPPASRATASIEKSACVR
jgi:hypothetical protein